MNLAAVVWILGQLGLLSGGIGNLLLSPQDVSGLLETKGSDEKLLKSITKYYKLACFLKVSAAGSTASPAALRGPALPLDPVFLGPTLPRWVTLRPSFVTAPVGHTY